MGTVVKPARSGHIVELQSLRGIAAVAVMIGHALVFYAVPSWFRTIALLFNGRAAVVVFFVLSGYVLTRSLRVAAFDQETVVRFYVQRVFRIYPAMLAASVLGIWYIYAMHWQIPVAQEGALLLGDFRADRYDALHIVASFAGMTTFILPQLWTIFIEIVASIAMPGIAFVALRRRPWLPVLLLAGVALSFTVEQSYYHITIYFMDFIVGAALAVPGLCERVFRNVPAAPVVGAGLVLLALTQQIPVDYWSPVSHLVETVLSAIIIGILVGARGRIPVLKSPTLLFVGDISFSVYLFHYPVLCILVKLLQLMQNGLHVELDPVTLSIMAAVLTTAVTMPLAWLSFSYIELPGVRLGKAAVTWAETSFASVRGLKSRMQ